MSSRQAITRPSYAEQASYSPGRAQLVLDRAEVTVALFEIYQNSTSGDLIGRVGHLVDLGEERGGSGRERRRPWTATPPLRRSSSGSPFSGSCWHGRPSVEVCTIGSRTGLAAPVSQQ